MVKRILVLHSGGMDSTTCLYKAHAGGAEVHSLGIDYGQRLSIELMFAKAQCERLEIPRDVVSLAWRKPVRQVPTNRSIAEMDKSVSPAFLPGRNHIFLAIGVAHAAGIQADEVHTGINSVDFSGYPDCTPEFLTAFIKTAQLADPNGPAIRAPLLKMSKPEIALLASKLGLGEHDTWSCYRPQIVGGRVEICGECDACKLHAFAWHPELVV